jgi:predicted nucleic-acid-binding protein
VLAVDTNVVVRLLVDDDERQTAQARRLFEADDVWIGITVLLEAAWVLASAYEMKEADVAASLRRLLGLPNVHVEDAAIVATALDAVAGGLELADALHLLRVPYASEFATFDRALARAGRKLGSVRAL